MNRGGIEAEAEKEEDAAEGLDARDVQRVALAASRAIATLR